MLLLHDLYPHRFADADGTHPIPESGNGRNDLVDEVLFEIDWMLRMQNADGSVNHKVHAADWPHGAMDPATDRTPRRVQPVSTEATLHLAALAARAARLPGTDEDRRAELLDHARRAWTWAEAHPERTYRQDTADDVGGGDYAADEFGGGMHDERYWAAAELYRATGQESYLRAARSSPAFTDATRPSWHEVGLLGTWALVSDPTLDAVTRDRLVSAISASADRTASSVRASSYRQPLGGSFPWGSSGDISNHVVLLAVAHRVAPKREHLDVGSACVDWLLGKNPLDYVFVTGHGPADQTAHNVTSHWLHHVGRALPGLLVGGPNNQFVNDPWTPREGPAALRYADIERAWASNEFAINWNAPMLLATVFLDEELAADSD